MMSKKELTSKRLDDKMKLIDEQGNLVKMRDLKTVSRRSEKNNLLDWQNLGIGYSLVVPILMGVFFGLVIDKFLHTKPVFTIVGIVFGVISSFYNLFKAK